MTTPLALADLEIQYLEKGLATLTALITRGTERGDDVHLVEIQAQTIRDRLAQLRGAEPALQPEPGRVPPPDETPTHYDLEDPTRYDPAVHRKFVLIPEPFRTIIAPRCGGWVTNSSMTKRYSGGARLV